MLSCTACCGTPSPRWGEGGGEGVRTYREFVTPHPNPLPMGEGGRTVRRNTRILRLLVCQPDAGVTPKVLAILVSLQARLPNAAGSEFLVAVLGVAGDTDRTDHLAR